MQKYGVKFGEIIKFYNSVEKLVDNLLTKMGVQFSLANSVIFKANIVFVVATTVFWGGGNTVIVKVFFCSGYL